MSLLGMTLTEEVDAVTKLSRRTASFGFILSEKDTKSLLSTRREPLRRFGRVAFGSGIVEQLICTFCDSPCLPPHQEQKILGDSLKPFITLKVKNRSKSVTDFIDLMKAGRFFGEDCPALFQRLSNGGLALLTAGLPGHGEANHPTEPGMAGCAHLIFQKPPRRPAA